MRFKRSVSSETVLGIPASFPPQQGTCAYCIKIAGQRKGRAQRRSRRATEAYSPNVVERLSGKWLCGSDRASFGDAKRRKRCSFAPFGSLVGPRNEALTEHFPDSL